MSAAEVEVEAVVECSSGKVRYATEYEARVGLVDAVVRRNRGKNQRRECRWYECPSCKGWHLTSMRTQPRPAK